MKIKISEAIKLMDKTDIARIIGAVIMMKTEGIPVDEALKFDYPETTKLLQEEIEVEYKPTNFDACCESIGNMAQMIDIMKCGWTKEEIIEWLNKSVT